jgi:prepilin-type processing-associated H-X9-DG protein
MFVYWYCYGIQDITDGTSNTVAFAESLVGDGGNNSAQYSLRKNNSVTGVTAAATAEVADASAVSYQNIIIPALNLCTTSYKAGAGTGTNISNANGNRWGWGAMSITLFNTVATPNSQPWNSCRDSCPGCGPDDSIFSQAQSNHSGGVNVLMGDGSARFIKNSINPMTWMALGTRANGETISADSY